MKALEKHMHQAWNTKGGILWKEIGCYRCKDYGPRRSRKSYPLYSFDAFQTIHFSLPLVWKGRWIWTCLGRSFGPFSVTSCGTTNILQARASEEQQKSKPSVEWLSGQMSGRPAVSARSPISLDKESLEWSWGRRDIFQMRWIKSVLSPSSEKSKSEP